MNIASALFCLAMLVASFFVAKAAFTAAALPIEVIEATRTPQSPELFDDVDIPDFGQISVLDMIDYYVENPPVVTESNGAAETKVRFQGC